MIRAESASLVYDDHGRDIFACRDVTLTIQPGEFLGILGPSGSGKSSLLYLLSGLKLPTSGSVMLDSIDFKHLGDEDRSRVRLTEFGFIFQYPYLLGYLSAWENVILALPDGDHDQARQLLHDLGLGEKLHRLPHELSGGERQRVCVARALFGNPRTIFADEPTASLDHTNGIQVVQALSKHRGRGALVMVTHDTTMLTDADRVVVINDGRIERIEER